VEERKRLPASLSLTFSLSSLPLSWRIRWILEVREAIATKGKEKRNGKGS